MKNHPNFADKPTDELLETRARLFDEYKTQVEAAHEGSATAARRSWTSAIQIAEIDSELSFRLTAQTPHGQATL